MKNLSKILIAAGIIALISIHAYSQSSSAQNYGAQSYSSTSYKTGIGVRLGGLTSGLTVKEFMNPTSAIEGILSFGYHNSVITGLYEKHNNINNAPGLRWFYGGGAHIGFFGYGSHYYYYTTDFGERVYVAREGETAVVGGLDFILGLDYKITNAPFTIGIDMKPFIDFYDTPTGYFDGAITFRFVF